MLLPVHLHRPEALQETALACFWTEAVQRALPRHARRAGSAQLRVSARWASTLSSGSCRPGQWTVHITLGVDADAALVSEILAHEVAHLVRPPARPDGLPDWHGAAFRQLLMDVIHQQWGVRTLTPSGREAIGAFDHRLTEALRSHFHRSWP